MDFSLLNNLIYKIVFFYFKVDLIGSLLSIQTPYVLRHWSFDDIFMRWRTMNSTVQARSVEKGWGGCYRMNSINPKFCIYLWLALYLLNNDLKKKEWPYGHYCWIIFSKYVTFLQSYTKLDWVLFRTSVA